MFTGIVLLAATALAAPLNAAPAIICAPGVQLFWARGTTEPQNLGLESGVVNAIVNAIPGSNSTGVVYPASFTLPASVNQGIKAMTTEVTQYAEACPSSKMVFMGYSQGAQVVGNVVSGGPTAVPGGSKTVANAPLSKKILSQVVSIIQFGDPNRIAPQPYDKDTCKIDATSPRTGAIAARWNSYASSIQSYCDAMDPVCCANGTNILAHLSYFNTANTNAIVAFVKARYNAA